MRVGVFVNAPEALITRAIAEVGLTMLQFHGDESPEDCLRFGLMSMKAFRMKDAGTLEQIAKYHTDAYLLDAYSPGVRGGTGHTFNWDLALEAQKFGKPIFVSGGLTPENVAEAIRKGSPLRRGRFERRGKCAREKRSRQSKGVHHRRKANALNFLPDANFPISRERFTNFLQIFDR